MNLHIAKRIMTFHHRFVQLLPIYCVLDLYSSILPKKQICINKLSLTVFQSNTSFYSITLHLQLKRLTIMNSTSAFYPIPIMRSGSYLTATMLSNESFTSHLQVNGTSVLISIASIFEEISSA